MANGENTTGAVAPVSAAHTPGPWHISASETGVHLMHDNYCVARLDARDPKRITDALSPHLVPASRADAIAPKLAKALQAVMVWMLNTAEPCASGHDYYAPLREDMALAEQALAEWDAQ